MAGSVGVLGAEGRAEGVHIGQGQGEYLGLQLAADGQEGGLAEEIRVVIHGAFLGGKVTQVQRGDAKHGSRAFGIASSDDWRMEINIAALLEEGVDGKRHCATHPGHCAKGVGTWAQVGHITQELQCVALLLQRVLFRVGQPSDLESSGGDLVTLALTRRFHQSAFDAYAAAGVQRVYQRMIGQVLVHHDLQVSQSGAVVNL